MTESFLSEKMASSRSSSSSARRRQSSAPRSGPILIHTLRIIGADRATVAAAGSRTSNSGPDIAVEYTNDVYRPKITGHVRIYLAQSDNSLSITYESDRDWRDKQYQLDAVKYRIKFSTIVVTGAARLAIRQSEGWYSMTMLGSLPPSGNIQPSIEHLTMSALRGGRITIAGDLDDCVVKEAIFSATERSSIEFQNSPLVCRSVHLSCYNRSTFAGLAVISRLMAWVGEDHHNAISRINTTDNTRLEIKTPLQGGSSGYREIMHLVGVHVNQPLTRRFGEGRTMALPEPVAVTDIDDEEEEEDEDDDGDGGYSAPLPPEPTPPRRPRRRRPPPRPHSIEYTYGGPYSLASLMTPFTLMNTIVLNNRGNGGYVIADDDDDEWEDGVERDAWVTGDAPAVGGADSDDGADDFLWLGQDASPSRTSNLERVVMEATRVAADRLDEMRKEPEREARKRKLQAAEEERDRKRAAPADSDEKKKDPADDKPSTECSICCQAFDSAKHRRGTFVVCGHAAACYTCAKRAYTDNGKCPFCRADSTVVELIL